MMSMGDVHGSVDDLGSEPRAPDEGAAPPPAGEQPGFGAAPQHGGGPSAHNFKRYVLYVGPSSRGGQQMCPGSQARIKCMISTMGTHHLNYIYSVMCP